MKDELEHSSTPWRECPYCTTSTCNAIVDAYGNHVGVSSVARDLIIHRVNNWDRLVEELRNCTRELERFRIGGINVTTSRTVPIVISAARKALAIAEQDP